MKKILEKYIPINAVEPVFQLIVEHHIYLKIVNERKTKQGDYKKYNNQNLITVNANLNKYSFLITLIHEIAHAITYDFYGFHIKPHGLEWKRTFQRLMLPLIHPNIFPKDLLPIIAIHFKNPRASSGTDAKLSIALQKYDEDTNKNFIFELPEGCLFKTKEGRIFRKKQKRVKRYLCEEISTGKQYVFAPNAKVEFIINQ